MESAIRKIYLFVITVLLHIITMSLWPVLIISCSIFLIYRKLVDFMLRSKIGEKYGGLLDIADSVMITNSSNKYLITCILIAKCDVETDFIPILTEKLKNKVFDYPHQYPKLTSTQQVFCGYPYWTKNNYKLQDCLKLISIPAGKEFNEESLKEVVGRINMKPFQKDDTGLWDITVSQTSLITDKSDEYYYYPVIIRLNHAIGDGTSLIQLFINILGDDSVENYSDKVFKKLYKKYTNKKIHSSMTKLKYILKEIMDALTLFFYVIVIGFGKTIMNTQLRSDDDNALHGPENSGHKIVAWHVEDDIKYIPIVKRTKNRVPGTKFSHVILTVISASLTNFFKRNKKSIPKTITGVLTVLLNFPTPNNSKQVELKNKTTLLVFDLPLNHSNTLIETLIQVKKKANEVRYGDALVNDFLLSKVAGIFPISIATKLLGCGQYTSLISNIPGGGLISIQEGCVIDKVIPFAPNARKVGISITILSYDDRFQVGVLVDKAIKLSQQDVQQIADDIFYFMKLLDIETETLFKDN